MIDTKETEEKKTILQGNSLISWPIQRSRSFLEDEGKMDVFNAISWMAFQRVVLACPE
jgi:hypothetical protein